MGREAEAQAWLKEARERYQNQKKRVANLKPRKGESQEHFANRKANEREQLEHREKVKNHLARKLEAIREAKEDHVDPDGDGLATFDGKTVAAWMIQWLEKSRKAGWTGTVVSGYRTPEYSESLCYAMCGHPSCPGTCAGRASNHSGKDYPAGACDVTDYARFKSIQWQIESPLRNDLPNDPVHFSVSGH